MACLQPGLGELEAELYEIRHVKEDLDSLEVAYKLQLEEVLSASANLAQGQQGTGSSEVVMLEVERDLAQARDLTTLQESELAMAAQGHVDSSLARELTTSYHKQAAQRQHDASVAIELHNLPSDEDSDTCEDMIDLAQDAPQGINVQLHFAGSWHREGGPAGWGAMLLSPTGEVLWQGSQHMGVTGLSQASYAALLAGLRKAQELGFTRVDVFGSSMVTAQVLGYADVQQSALMGAHADATAAIGQMQSFQLGQGPADARVHALAQAAMHGPAGNSFHLQPACSKSQQVPDVVVTGEEEAAPQQCKICLEDVPGSAVHVVGACLHRFCRACLVQHAVTLIHTKTFPIRCPEAACKQEVSPSECHVLLVSAPEELQAYLQMAAEASIPESRRVYCPFPACGVLLMHEDATLADQPSECPACHRAFCAGCRAPWHTGLTCAQYKLRRTPEDRAFMDLADRARWRQCPQCQAMIELAAGCNHMTCKCSAQFCYVCGEPWVPDPGQPTRFRATCECALWDEANIMEEPEEPDEQQGYYPNGINQEHLELARQRAAARIRNRHNPRHPFYKTQLCRHHPYCRNGDHCNFAHGEHELQGRPDAYQQPDPYPNPFRQGYGYGGYYGYDPAGGYH